MNGINHIRVGSKIEANVAPGEILEALKKQIFDLDEINVTGNDVNDN